MNENRLERKFHDLRALGRKAFVAYITAGDPSPVATPELIWALERAGADVVELGVPFSDPLADGPVNQLSAQRALEAGTTPAGVLELIKVIRTRSQIPLVLYTYFNLVCAHGIERFCLQAQAAGADGLLILDLPPEEVARTGADVTSGLLARIALVAPTTPAGRLPAILEKAGGFVYAISREGVTGMQEKTAAPMSERVALLRRHTALPICIGFGVSTPDQARQVAAQADGVIIGSALVSRIAEWTNENDLPARLEQFARPLAEAIHSVS